MKESEIVNRLATNRNFQTRSRLYKLLSLADDHLTAAEVSIDSLLTFISTRYPDFGLDTEVWKEYHMSKLHEVLEALDVIQDNFEGYFEGENGESPL